MTTGVWGNVCVGSPAAAAGGAPRITTLRVTGADGTRGRFADRPVPKLSAGHPATSSAAADVLANANALGDTAHALRNAADLRRRRAGLRGGYSGCCSGRLRADVG